MARLVMLWDDRRDTDSVWPHHWPAYRPLTVGPPRWSVPVVGSTHSFRPPPARAATVLVHRRSVPLPVAPGAPSTGTDRSPTSFGVSTVSSLSGQTEHGTMARFADIATGGVPCASIIWLARAVKVERPFARRLHR